MVAVRWLRKKCICQCGPHKVSEDQIIKWSDEEYNNWQDTSLCPYCYGRKVYNNGTYFSHDRPYRVLGSMWAGEV